MCWWEMWSWLQHVAAHRPLVESYSYGGTRRRGCLFLGPFSLVFFVRVEGWPGRSGIGLGDVGGGWSRGGTQGNVRELGGGYWGRGSGREKRYCVVWGQRHRSGVVEEEEPGW